MNLKKIIIGIILMLAGGMLAGTVESFLANYGIPISIKIWEYPVIPGLWSIPISLSISSIMFWLGAVLLVIGILL